MSMLHSISCAVSSQRNAYSMEDAENCRAELEREILKCLGCMHLCPCTLDDAMGYDVRCDGGI